MSDGALTTRLNAARSAIGDSGEEQRLIKTLPRKGFRFVGTVRERRARRREVIDNPVEQPKPALTLPDKPSIAVLPFANLSSDPEQEYFADGVVEDITMALSRFGWLFVIARNSSFTYKGRAVDVKQIGRELGVRYVLEGSVRKAAGKVRITGQLIDATTGTHLWADRFEGDLSDIFALQDRDDRECRLSHCTKDCFKLKSIWPRVGRTISARMTFVFEHYRTSSHGPGADRPRPFGLSLAHWRLTLGTAVAATLAGDCHLGNVTSGMGGRSEVGNCRRIAASPVGTQYRRERPRGIEHTWRRGRHLRLRERTAVLARLGGVQGGERCPVGAGDACPHRSLSASGSSRSERFRDRLPYPDPAFFFDERGLDSCADELVAEHRVIQDLQHRRCRGAGLMGGRQRSPEASRRMTGMEDGQARFGEPQLIRPRLGQGAFRVLVTDIYQRRCAVTQERTLPALEAAHIRPYGDGGEHEARNGLLLRRDIHSLFDAGYVTVTPDLRFEVSRRIREEFDNGKHYYALHGRTIDAPTEVRPAARSRCPDLAQRALFQGMTGGADD